MLARFARLLRRAFPDRAEQPPAPESLPPPPPDALQDHVRYAIAIAESYLGQLRRADVSLEGARLLELGPGSDFGPALILASHGARVTIVDRFMDNQDREHHCRFNQRLLETWTGPDEAIRRAVAGDGYDGILTLESAEVERLPCPDASFDAILSNAVLEHVVNLAAASRELLRVTAPGGVNIHQVDLRDHRDFDRPLEYLLSPTDDFEPTSLWPGQFGSRRRAPEVEQLFRDAGFAVDAAEINGLATDDYLDDFMVRLAQSASPYRSWTRDDLKNVGLLLWLRKPG